MILGKCIWCDLGGDPSMHLCDNTAKCVWCDIKGHPSLLVQVRDKTSTWLSDGDWLCRDCHLDYIDGITPDFMEVS